MARGLGAEGGEPSVNLTLTSNALHPPAPFFPLLWPQGAARRFLFSFSSFNLVLLLFFCSLLCLFSFFFAFFFVKIAQVRRRHGGWQGGLRWLAGCLTFGIIDLEFWSFAGRQKEHPCTFRCGWKNGERRESTSDG